MKDLNENELFRNLSGFLKSKGIALKEGPYTQRIRQGCSLLTDAINLTQDGFQRAKSEVDAKLDQMRRVIRKKEQAGPAPSAAKAKSKAKNARTTTRSGRPRSTRPPASAPKTAARSGRRKPQSN